MKVKTYKPKTKLLANETLEPFIEAARCKVLTEFAPKSTEPRKDG